MTNTAIAPHASPAFDAGPLSWVKPEIDRTFELGLSALATYAASPGNAMDLTTARRHVHQAAGAVRMVGLDALSAFTDEIEASLAWLESAPPASVAPMRDAIDQACRRLRLHLDELINGSPPRPLGLFAEYEAMQKLRGIAPASPVDLFFPDLALRPVRTGIGQQLPAPQLAALLTKARRVFQQGLLGWLRGAPEGLQQMRAAVQAIEHTQAGTQRAFWWTTTAFLDALLWRGLDPSYSAKQLCARIDLQIRRFIDGSAKVADRLRREVLYHVAISRPVVQTIEEVQAVYRLAALIPPADGNADLWRVQPALRRARELMVPAKEAWLRLNSGRPDALPRLQHHLQELGEQAAQIGHPDLIRLVKSLSTELARMPVDPVPDAVALEYATGMLLAESAIENFASLQPDFARNVDAMIVRLESGGAPVDRTAVPILDEMARRAQERLLLAQVAKEIQTNLRHIEQVLDGFFRDHSRRAELAGLGRYTRQIKGALAILGLDRAERLLALCEEQIALYERPGTPVTGDDLEMLAESLSGLGFYIEAIEQQRSDGDRLIEPLLRKRLGVGEEIRREREASLESTLQERLAALPALVAALDGPNRAGTRADLRQRLTAVRHDAELTASASLAEQAAAALARLDDDSIEGRAALAGAVARLAQPAVVEPAPGPSADALRLVSVSKEKLDAELIEIYLAEAGDVLASVAEQLGRLQQFPDDREALRTIRRGFHTLKGSGRMVGLTELGELAWKVERVQNRWLETDRGASPALLALIDVARSGFAGWVAALARDSSVTVDASALEAAIARVEVELPPVGPGGPGGPGGGRPVPVASSKPAEARGPVAELRLVEPGPLGSGNAAAPAVEDAPAITLRAPDCGGADVAAGPRVAFVSSHGGECVPAQGRECIPGRGGEVAHIGRANGEECVDDVDAGATSDGFAPAEEAVPDAADAMPRPRSVRVGEVAMSETLHQILCEEAQQHVRTLHEELGRMRLEQPVIASDAMVRASHTLKGIHRTGGFDLVADTAWALERCVQALRDRPASREIALPALNAGVAALVVLTGRVKSLEAFRATDRDVAASAIDALDALRRAIDGAGAPADAVACECDPAAALPAALDPAASGDPDRLPICDDGGGTSPLPSAVVLPFGRPAARGPASVHPAALGPASTEAELAALLPELIGLTPSGALDLDSLLPAGDAAGSTEAADPAASVGLAHAPHPAAPRAESAGRTPATAPAFSPSDTLAPELAAIGTVRDDVDPDVLPIFLEEAQELFPRAGEDLRAWRRNAHDHDASRRLRRTLHTFKGSARMAGAMRLGELAHSMESRLLAGDGNAVPTPELFDALEVDLDRVAWLVERLQEGDFESPLPWLSPRTTRSGAAQALGVEPSLGGAGQLAAPALVALDARAAEPHAAIVREADARIADVHEADVRAVDAVAADVRTVGVGGAHPADATGTIADAEWVARERADALAAFAALDALDSVTEGDGTPRDVAFDSLLRDAGMVVESEACGHAPSAEVEAAPAADGGCAPIAEADVAQTPIADATRSAGAGAAPASVTAAMPTPVAGASATCVSDAEAIPDAGVDPLASVALAGAEALLADAERLAPVIGHVQDLEAELAATLAELGVAVDGRLDDQVDGTVVDLRGERVVAPMRAVEEEAGTSGAQRPESGEGASTAADSLSSSAEAAASTANIASTTVATLSADRAAANEPSRIGPPIPIGASPPSVAGVSATTPATGAPGAERAAAGVAGEAAGGRGATGRPDAAEPEVRERALLRVRADVVDRLVNEAGEVSIARARIEGELRALKSSLIELTSGVVRLRTQVRELEMHAETQIQSRLSQVQESASGFDPLEFDRFTRFQELTRSLAESINDVSSVHQAMLKNLDDANAALVTQGRMSRDVQQALLGIRTMPFASLSDRLHRLVRQTARELGKRATLEIRGSQVELDRSVLDKLAGPFEHLLRNAIDHGLESREARAQAGKPETGQIVVSARQHGNEVVIELDDDGRGIDFEALRERAAGLGMIAAGHEPSRAQLVDLMFAPGFTTAKAVTQISGRGIGLDVVRSDIVALGGRIEVSSESGRGTRFTLVLPLTLAVAQVAVVRVAGRLYAVPAPMVEHVQQVRSDELIDLYVSRRMSWQGQSHAFFNLGRLLGDPEHTPDADRYNAVLLVRSGGNVVAVHVDQMLGNQEVVVKNIGPQLARVVGITGATVLGNGEVVLIINPVQLALRQGGLLAGGLAAANDGPLPQAKEEGLRPRVLVVDDSLTVRRITTRLLNREGFEVFTARDGVEALQVLAENRPDLMLLDIEMPRMDGFELAGALRGDVRYAHLPIVMITSRTAEKHRQRAHELGVEHYFGKPYQEHELLATMRGLLARRAAAA